MPRSRYATQQHIAYSIQRHPQPHHNLSRVRRRYAQVVHKLRQLAARCSDALDNMMLIERLHRSSYHTRNMQHTRSSRAQAELTLDPGTLAP
eukprot:scaffold3037_cov109-Isochrysis_galbana.AAC.2